MKKLLFTILLLVTCLDLHGATAMKISDYQNTNNMNDTDLILIAIPGVTNKNMTWLQLRTLINATRDTNFAGIFVTNLNGYVFTLNSNGVIAGSVDLLSNVFINGILDVNGFQTNRNISYFQSNVVVSGTATFPEGVSVSNGLVWLGTNGTRIVTIGTNTVVTNNSGLNMVITPNGNLGIGKIPNERLNIGYPRSLIRWDNATATVGYAGVTDALFAGSGITNLGLLSANELWLGVASSVPALHIKRNTFVGIGTNNPQAELHVRGSILTDSNLLLRAITVTNLAGISDMGQLFASTNNVSGLAEVYVADESGNITLISPHASDGPTNLYDAGWNYVTKEVQQFAGKVRWINHSREARLTELNTKGVLLAHTKTNTAAWTNRMEAVQELLDMSAGERQVLMTESFAEYNARTGGNLVALDWGTVQTNQWNLYAISYTNALNAFNAAVASGDTNAVAPTWNPPSIKRKPKFL